MGAIDQLDIPREVVSVFHGRGITTLNAVQQESVDRGLFGGANQLIVAPTSSGKTLIAELACIHHALHKKGSFYLVSLKALAEEKYDLFKRFWASTKEPVFRTGITTGDRDFDDENLSQCKVTFATFEKFFSLMRDSPSLLNHVSLIIVDEFHTLGDKKRGFTLEAGLTWIRMYHPKIQIIGLSAALPNAPEVANWLGATVCKSTVRDIPLTEEVWSGDSIHWKIFGHSRDDIQKRNNPTSSTETLAVVQYLVSQNKAPIVVFCMTKPRAEQLAHQHLELVRKKTSIIKRVIHELKQRLLFFTEGGPTGKSLMTVVDANVAFHHSDLSFDERRLIEEKIRDGAIDVTYSTTTLGQGVNLPVAVVVFDDVYRGFQDTYIDRREYINMAGRAGRRGLQDSGGTAILICRSAKDRLQMNAYLTEDAEYVESTLENADFDAVILSLIVSREFSTLRDIQGFIADSFFGLRNFEKNPVLLRAKVEAVPKIIRQLSKDGFVFEESARNRATELGRIACRKGVTPATCKELIRRLKILEQAFPSVDSRDEDGRKSDIVGPILHLFLDADTECGPMFADFQSRSYLERHRPAICKLRPFESPANPYQVFQIAWVLKEWAAGIPFANICAPFRAVREGNIRGCADHCSWLLETASAISHLRQLGIDPRLSHLLGTLTKRVKYGVPREGIQLMDIVWNRAALGVELGGIGRSKVLDLVRHGLGEVSSILEADEQVLLGILRNKGHVESLKTAIVKYLEAASNSLRPSHLRRSKPFSKEDLIKKVYEKRGTEFEASVHDLLRAVGIDAELLDEKKVPGCADILVRTGKGVVQVECKTKENGSVGNSEAFEVLGKTRVGETPKAFATIGKPSFADIAVSNSFEKGVALVGHQVLAEAIVQVIEGKKKKEDVELLFFYERFVDIAEVR